MYPMPRLRCKPDETYTSAYNRWRNRVSAWKDWRIMLECTAARGKRKRAVQAFHGLKVMDIAE